MSVPSTRFRLAFLPILFVHLACFPVVAAAFGGYAWLIDEKMASDLVHGDQMPLISCFVFSSLFLMSCMMGYVGFGSGKVSVSPTTLRARSFWGRYYKVSWSEITDVRPITLVHLKYLRVYCAKLPRPLWVPLFLADQEGFNQLIHQYAGPENLLVRALRDG